MGAPSPGLARGRTTPSWGLAFRLRHPGVSQKKAGCQTIAVKAPGSDGSQQEGNDAEAARIAVARRLNVKLVIDDNDVTIAGPGLTLIEGDGEDIDGLFGRLCEAAVTPVPFAIVNTRKMCVGMAGLEGSAHGHTVK